MAQGPSISAKSDEQNSLTLTKAEIAFLNATIELMLEEQGGRSESVTIAVHDPAALAGWLVKGFKALNKVVNKYGGWAVIATEVVDAVFGLSAEPARISREQAEIMQRFRTAAKQGVSLEQLLDLRDRLQRQQVEAGSVVTRAEE